MANPTIEQIKAAMVETFNEQQIGIKEEIAAVAKEQKDLVSLITRQTDTIMGLTANLDQLNIETKAGIASLNQKYEALEARMRNAESTINNGSRGSDEPAPQRRKRALSEDLEPNRDQKEVNNNSILKNRDDDSTILLLGFPPESDKETRKKTTEAIIKEKDANIGFELSPCRKYGSIVFVKFPSPDEARNFLKCRNAQGEARPFFDPEDGGDTVPLRWDSKKDDRRLKKEKATGKLASALHTLNEDKFDKKLDIQCERGPGVVYVNRKLAARINVDPALAATLHFYDKVLSELSIDKAELDALFLRKMSE